MATSISELKRRVAEVSKGVQNGTIGAGKKAEDSRFFYPTLNAEGIGFAIIRFLPSIYGTLHWSQAFSHGFKGPTGKWLIEECPTTKGHDCPICQSNSELWETGLEYNKQIVRERKRKETFYYNILVVSHPSNPADEGTVRLFKSGPVVYNMLMAAQKPKFPGEPVIDAFDPWNGANFALKIYRDDNKNIKYDKSAFAAPSCIGTDEYIEEILNKSVDLAEFTADSKYKTYDELKKRLNFVLGLDDTEKSSAAPAPSKSEEEPKAGKSASSPSGPSTPAPSASSSGSSDDDDPLKMFEDLAQS